MLASTDGRGSILERLDFVELVLGLEVNEVNDFGREGERRVVFDALLEPNLFEDSAAVLAAWQHVHLKVNDANQFLPRVVYCKQLHIADDERVALIAGQRAIVEVRGMLAAHSCVDFVKRHLNNFVCEVCDEGLLVDPVTLGVDLL